MEVATLTAHFSAISPCRSAMTGQIESISRDELLNFARGFFQTLMVKDNHAVVIREILESLKRKAVLLDTARTRKLPKNSKQQLCP
jgi:hypothetical protein